MPNYNSISLFPLCIGLSTACAMAQHRVILWVIPWPIGSFCFRIALTLQKPYGKKGKLKHTGFWIGASVKVCLDA